MSGILYIVATPIGNLADMTFRAVDTLKQVSVIAAEDTRVTHKLLSKYQIETPLVSYREQNAERVIPMLLEKLQNGSDVAAVSDAGTPAISDPGSELVRAAVAAGVQVSPIPGASAMSAAISVSPLEGDGVRFIGFLPRKGKERKERLSTIAQDPSCTVIYESPHRLKQTLLDLAAACETRKGTVFRELTKLHEEIRVGEFAELAAHFSGEVRGEITIVVEGNRAVVATDVDDVQLAQMISAELQKKKSAKDIAASLSTALGIRKKKIYDLAVSIIQQK